MSTSVAIAGSPLTYDVIVVGPRCVSSPTAKLLGCASYRVLLLLPRPGVVLRWRAAIFGRSSLPHPC